MWISSDIYLLFTLLKISTSYECLVDHTSYIACYKIADAFFSIKKKIGLKKNFSLTMVLRQCTVCKKIMTVQ
jgi:hypothetical protein